MTWLLAVLAVAVLALVWHGITEHHWHLRWFWRYVCPDTTIPLPRPDGRWHGAGHGFRALVNTGMLAAAGFGGLGWQLQPRVAAAAVIAVTGLGTVALAARILARRLGERRRPYPGLED